MTPPMLAETSRCLWADEHLQLMLPKLRKPDSDIYQLMRQLSKSTEQVDAVQASSVERVLFGLSSDDPSILFKILRPGWQSTGCPVLTDRGDVYRLKYSFPLYRDSIPEALRDK